MTGFSLFDYDKESGEKYMNITVDKVKKIIDNYDDYSDVYIVDVREEHEYVEGHINNAINIPLSYIEYVDFDLESKIIVYCRSGRRSKEAIGILLKLGYKNVFDMGVINDWPYDLVKS